MFKKMSGMPRTVRQSLLVSGACHFKGEGFLVVYFRAKSRIHHNQTVSVDEDTLMLFALCLEKQTTAAAVPQKICGMDSLAQIYRSEGIMVRNGAVVLMLQSLM